MYCRGTISANGSTKPFQQWQFYTGKPQVIVSGGSWRYTDDTVPDHESLSASSGLILEREASGGIEAFIDINPFE